MSTDTALVYQTDESTQSRTFLVGIRLFLAANTMLMGAFLFAYLYLRANNNAGMWRPDGIADLSSVPMAIILLLQLACLVVGARGRTHRPARGGCARDRSDRAPARAGGRRHARLVPVQPR